MAHQHKHYRFGDEMVCICGDRRADTRTQEQVAAAQERATLAHKIRLNAAMGVDSPTMKARLAELTR